MAYAPHFSVQISGYMGAPSQRPEIFSTGFALSGPLDADIAAHAQTMSNLIGTWWGSGDCGVGNNAHILQVKFSPKGPDGHNVSQPTIVLVGGAGLPAGGGPSTVPYQVARVMSLGGKSESKRHKGRMYLPCPTGEVDGATGLWAGGHEQAAADRLKELFSSINAAGTGHGVIVASHFGINAGVAEVRAGNVPGVVRRRRDALVETYASAIVIPFPGAP